MCLVCEAGAASWGSGVFGAGRGEGQLLVGRVYFHLQGLWGFTRDLAASLGKHRRDKGVHYKPFDQSLEGGCEAGMGPGVVRHLQLQIAFQAQN